MNRLIEKEPSLEFVIPVLKWLKDPESVGEGEIRANYEATFDAFHSTAAYDVTYSTAKNAAYAGCTAYVEFVVCNVDKYFSKISITRKEVEAELLKDKE
jgi:uncharacterized membrane protein